MACVRGCYLKLVFGLSGDIRCSGAVVHHERCRRNNQPSVAGAIRSRGRGSAITSDAVTSAFHASRRPAICISLARQNGMTCTGMTRSCPLVLLYPPVGGLPSPHLALLRPVRLHPPLRSSTRVALAPGGVRERWSRQG